MDKAERRELLEQNGGVSGKAPNFEKGVNPRDYLSRHKERGPVAITFTRHNVAKQLGVSTHTVSAHPETHAITGLSRFVAHNLGFKSKLLTEEDAAQYVASMGGENWGELYVEKRAEQWSKRWPRFHLYTCGYKDCPNVSFAPGVCPKCGGYKPALAFGERGHIYIFAGVRMVPMKRIMLNGLTGSYIWFKDDNKWNLRSSNLEVLTEEQHNARMGARRSGAALEDF